MKAILAATAAMLLAVSCAPVTPQARIDRNPRIFESLPERHKPLVARGEIARGMSKDAVWLAWGAPSQRFEGFTDGRRTDRWDYDAHRPVHHTTYYGTFGYGYGLGRYGRYGYPYGAYGIGPEVTYIPYRRASVWFAGDSVEGWERLR